MNYNLLKPWLSLDQWQKDYINEKRNCFLLCGRQSGKTTAASIKFGKRAVENPNHTILMIAFTEKQAYNLFIKTLVYLEQVYPMMICKGKKKPTQHIINLKNGSKIMCHAAGQTGLGLVGYTVNSLVVDEAAAMNREIFILLTPTLSVTKGTIDLLSTPRGKEGYFYECSLRDDFKKFYVSAEDCPRHDKAFLDAEKSRMSQLEYAQEYLAMFLDDLKRLFNDELLKKCCMLKRREYAKGRLYLGCDIAGMGEDISTYEIIDKIDNEHFEQVDNITTERTYTTEVSENIIRLHKLNKFKKIGIDDGGIGFGVFSELLRNTETRSRTIALNNSSRDREYSKDSDKKTRLLKEDMYFNLLALMEHDKLKLLDDDELIDSLKSVQWELAKIEGHETIKPTKPRIFGRNTHIAEGLIRAAWLAYQDKSLNIWIDSIKQ